MILTEAPLRPPAPELTLPCADAFNRYAPPVARLMQSLPESVFVQGQYSGLKPFALGYGKNKQWVRLEGCRCFVKSIWSCNKMETDTLIYEKLTADIAADMGFPNASAAFLPDRYATEKSTSLSLLSVEPFNASKTIHDLLFDEVVQNPRDDYYSLTISDRCSMAAINDFPEIIPDFVRLASCDLWTGNNDRHSDNITISKQSDARQRLICGIDPVDDYFADVIFHSKWKLEQAVTLRQMKPADRDRPLDEAISTIEAYPDERIYERATRLDQLGHKGWNGESVADILMTRKRMLRAQTAMMLKG